MAAEARAFNAGGGRGIATSLRSAQMLLFPPAAPAAPARSRATVRPLRPMNAAEAGRSARLRALRANALAGLFVLAIGLFHVWTGLAVGQLGYALSDARALTDRLDQELHELTIEYAAETAPRRLEEAARARLGLHPPAPGQVVVLP